MVPTSSPTETEGDTPLGVGVESRPGVGPPTTPVPYPGVTSDPSSGQTGTRPDPEGDVPLVPPDEGV